MKELVLAFLLIILVSSCNQCIGQGNIIVKGSVVEIESSLPLQFSSIAILHSTHGTISNEAGNFELSIASDFVDDTLKVSFIGYTTVLIPISQLVSKQNVRIELTKEHRLLNEIIVTGKKPDAKKIVVKAIDRIFRNYISGHHLMEAFYSEQVFNATIKSFNSVECVVSIDDPGIRKTDSLVQIQIKEMRKGLEYLPGAHRDSTLKSFINKVFLGHNSYNNIYWLFSGNPVRTYGYNHRYDKFFYGPVLKPGFVTQFEFEMTDYWIENGTPIYEISFVQKAQQPEYSRAEFNATIPKEILAKPTLNLDSLYESRKQARKFFIEKMEPTRGKVYINANDFGILKLAFDYKILNPQGVWALVSKTEMQFAKYNERYYLEFICDVNARKDKGAERYNVKYLYVNTIRDYKNASRAVTNNNVNKISRWDDLWSIPYEYHASFWENSDAGLLHPIFDISTLIKTLQ